MLNLNLNTLLTRLRELPPEKSAIDYVYSMRTFVSAGFLEPEAFATMSIEANPYQPFTLYITGSDESGNVTSGSLIGVPVIVAISGSGEWPLTGSVESKIFVTNNFGFNLTEKLVLSEAEGNLNLSGSIISTSFAPEDKRPYVIFGTVTHTKGNIFNPDINWQVVNVSPVSNTLPVNGYTSSVSFVKDEFVPLFAISEITGSEEGSFMYLYNLGVTASMEADINNVTGSTTMSFNSPQAGINEVFEFFNPDTTKAIATASFLADNDNPYDFTASVEYNKGNIYDNNLNWKALQTSTTEDLEGNGTNLNGVSSSFKIDKDIANKVDISEVTGSVDGTFTNEYSFNQTASLTQNVNNVTGSVTMSISVPELGLEVTDEFFNPDTETASISLEFESISTDDYNITASVTNNKGNESNADINYQITASNLTAYKDFTAATSSFEFKKDIAVIVTGSVLDGEINDTYKNDYSFNQTASISSSYTKFTTADSSSKVRAVARLQIPEVGVDLYSYDENSLLTGSFEAEVASEYNATASFDLFADTTIEYVLIGGGGAGGGARVIQDDAFSANNFRIIGGGGGAGAVVTGSIRIHRGRPYDVTIGAGGLVQVLNTPPGDPDNPFLVPSTLRDGQASTFSGPLVPLDEVDLYPSFSNSNFIIAPGGGGGGGRIVVINGIYFVDAHERDGFAGGSGGGAGATGQNLSNAQVDGFGGGIVSASVLSTSSYDLDLVKAGFNGANNRVETQFNFQQFRNAGGGGGCTENGGTTSTGRASDGGRGTTISWVTINNGSVGGGGGGGNHIAQSSGGTNVSLLTSTAFNGGGYYQRVTGDFPGWSRFNPVQHTGGGGAGRNIRTESNNFRTWDPMNGASGSMSIRYLGPPQATGGTITESGGYTIHTFTGSGQFTFTTDFI